MPRKARARQLGDICHVTVAGPHESRAIRHVWIRVPGGAFSATYDPKNDVLTTTSGLAEGWHETIQAACRTLIGD